MSSAGTRYFEFEDFILDARRRTLSRGGTEIPISSRQFDLLYVFVRNEGRTITHEELLDEVWSGAFVEQSNLKKGISALRQILGETPSASQYIKTVPRRGYVFVPRVRTLPDEAETVAVVATEVVIEEEVFDDAMEVRALPAKSGSAKKLIVMALVAGLLLIGAAAIVRVWRQNRIVSNGFLADRVRVSRVTDDGNCWDSSISADGNFILCGRKTKEGLALVAKQISAASEITLLPPEKNISLYSFRISPDGASVYYVLDDSNDTDRNGLYQIAFLGGASRKIAPAAAGHISVSPDGKSIAFVRIKDSESQVVNVRNDGTGERVLASYGAGFRIWGLNFAPDGTTLLCSARRQTADRIVGLVDEIAIDGDEPKRLIEFPDRVIFSAAWIIDRSGIVLGLREPSTQDQQIWQYAVPSGEMLRVTNDTNSYRMPVFNQTGSILLTTQERMNSTITVKDQRSDSRFSMTGEEAKYSHVNWTPDGRIVFTSFESGSAAVWIMNADGSAKRRITDGKDNCDLKPRLSADGREIVFSSMRGGTRALWRVGLDGLGLVQLTPNSTDSVWEGTVLRDGRTVVWDAEGPSGTFLWIRRGGNEPVKFLPENVGLWDISPDERFLAIFVEGNAGDSRIEIRSVETGEPVQRFEARPEYVLRWTGDDAIIYTTQTAGQIRVFKQEIRGGPPKVILERDGEINEVMHSFDIDPDGDRSAFSISKILADAVTIRGAETK